jgi:hypothetical protein
VGLVVLLVLVLPGNVEMVRQARARGSSPRGTRLGGHVRRRPVELDEVGLELPVHQLAQLEQSTAESLTIIG